MTDTIDHVRSHLDGALVEDAASGRYQVRRDIFTDEEIFELEMKHIFEGNWVYLAHESQVPNAGGDYFTTYIGRQPVVITRDKDGELHCLINACSHRGAMLCRRKTDNRTTFTCPFHGWTFRNNGKLLKVKDPREAGYPEQFNTDGSHDLTKVARFGNYRGFLFGSLNADVASLEDHLGDATKIIDMVVDQSPEGLEVLRGASTYTYDGNWKLQAENGADGYHVSATHWNYAATTARRTAGESANETKAMDAGTWGKQGGGYHSFENGHLLLWMWWGNPQDRPPLYPPARTHWPPNSGRRKPNSWSGHRATCACTEHVPDGPVLVADPALPADLGGQDRGDDLLHRPQGRAGRGPRQPDPPVRGLLQRDRHGHPGRSRGVPVLPEDVPRDRRTVERHEPRRHPRAQRPPRPGREGPRHGQRAVERCEDRGRGPLPDPAQLLARDDAQGHRAEAESTATNER